MSIFSRKKKPAKEDKKASVKKVEKAQKEEAVLPEEEKATGKVVSMPAIASRLIIKPLLTEKATDLDALRQYVFVIDKRANKTEVKKEVERLFDVKVESVNIINKKRKRRVWRGKVGFSPGLKKAIVTLVEGDKIEIITH